MALQAFVFFKQQTEPGLAELQSAIVAESLDIHLPILFDINSKVSIAVQAKYKSGICYFDYVQDDHDSQTWQWNDRDSKLISDLDTVSVFSTNTGKQDTRAMVGVAAVLTKITAGVMHCDIFSENLIESDKAVELATSKFKVPNQNIFSFGKKRA